VLTTEEMFQRKRTKAWVIDWQSKKLRRADVGKIVTTSKKPWGHETLQHWASVAVEQIEVETLNILCLCEHLVSVPCQWICCGSSHSHVGFHSHVEVSQKGCRSQRSASRPCQQASLAWCQQAFLCQQASLVGLSHKGVWEPTKCQQAWCQQASLVGASRPSAGGLFLSSLSGQACSLPDSPGVMKRRRLTSQR
jgi:hypothetical protein